MSGKSWVQVGMLAALVVLAGGAVVRGEVLQQEGRKGAARGTEVALGPEPGRVPARTERRRPLPNGLSPTLAPAATFRVSGESAPRASPLMVRAWAAAEAVDDLGTAVPLGSTPLPEFLNELRQSVAVLPGGGFAVVWVEGEPPTQVVRLQYVRPTGEVVFGGGGLSLATGALASAVLVPHTSSGVLVAYSRAENPGSSQIAVQWVDGEGRLQWSADGTSAFGPLAVNQVFTEPSLVAGADGGVFVCAMRTRFGDDTPIVCQSLSATGEPRWGTEGVTAGGRRGWRVLPRAVSDGESGILVVWWNNRLLRDARIDRVLVEGQRFAGNGRALWGARGRVLRRSNLPEHPYYIHSQLGVVADGSGGAVIAFDDWNGALPATRDVFAQRVAGDGRLRWGQGIPVAAGRVPQQLDSLIATGDGGAVVTVWEPRTVTRGPLRSYRLRPAGGHAWGRAGRPLSDPAATALDFSSHGHSDGERVRIAWVHQRTPATESFDLYLAEYSLDGQRLVPPAGLPLFTAPRGQFLRGFVDDPTHGAALAVFEDVAFQGDHAAEWDVAGALYESGSESVDARVEGQEHRSP